jgi:hypothetical protein
MYAGLQPLLEVEIAWDQSVLLVQFVSKSLQSIVNKIVVADADSRQACEEGQQAQEPPSSERKETKQARGQVDQILGQAEVDRPEEQSGEHHAQGQSLATFAEEVHPLGQQARRGKPIDRLID